MQKRSVFYIDGWNLFTAIDKLNQPHCKWTSLWDLGQLMIPKRDERLEGVKFFWAHLPSAKNRESGRLDRQMSYVRALRATGVDCRLAHFNKRPTSCKKCGNTWHRPEEKETDVAIGVQLLVDAMHDLFDVAYLVSADGDLAPAARALVREFPKKELVTVTPPNMYHSAGIRECSSRKLTITQAHLERCLLPETVVSAVGSSIQRPIQYAFSVQRTVIPPFLVGFDCRTHTAVCSFNF